MTGNPETAIGRPGRRVFRGGHKGTGSGRAWAAAYDELGRPGMDGDWGAFRDEVCIGVRYRHRVDPVLRGRMEREARKGGGLLRGARGKGEMASSQVAEDQWVAAREIARNGHSVPFGVLGRAGWALVAVGWPVPKLNS